MTDKTKRQLALLDDVRRLERTFETSAAVAPSTSMLYLGSPLLAGDLAADALAWLGAAELALRGIGPAQRLLHFLRTFAAGPTETMALTCVEAGWEILHGPFETEMRRDELEIVRDAYARAAFYAWCLGSPEAALHVAQHAAAMLRRVDSELFKVRFAQTMLAALRTAEDGYPWGKFDVARERTRALDVLVGLGELVPDVRLAQRAYLAEQVLEEAKGKFSGSRVADLDDREGIARTGDFEIDEPVVGPSLVVVPSLDHLPDKRNDRGAPRSEFGHLAQRALPLVKMPDLAEASAVLKGEFPWLSAVTDRILEGVVGKEAVVFPSAICLVGGAGAGKSHYARAVARVLSLPLTEVPMGGAADSSFGGTSRQWSTGRACTVLQSIKRAGVANPCVILDELDKASSNRFNGSALDVVLAQIEPGSRKAFFDPFLEAAIDLSAVTFIATVNDIRPLKGPLLDRMLVLYCPAPTAQDIDAIVAGILRQVREGSGIDPRFTPDLDATEMDVLRRGWRGGSIRPLKRAVDRLLTLRSAPGLAH
ncbi:AAA family ATPase [Microvirga sp. G4-2]|uniref:AAA family ATPase n=1 Tax=Microvirga sp. G4-2 TaxID=3434467 RepID=UPI004043A3C5